MVEPLGQAELVNESYEVALFTSFNGELFREVLLNYMEEAFFDFLEVGHEK